MMMVLVSKQHKVTTKYKMQTTLHFSLNAGQVGFNAVDFEVTWPAGRVAVWTIFEAC